jgi:GntR family transcriptional repressor for pyruvate dehydrogenase complex
MLPHRRKPDVTTKLLTTFKKLISEGTLAPGSRLPAEREMALRLKVSRGSLRQALKTLVVMGVVSQRVGDGTYLNGAAPGILTEPMEFLILLEGISHEELMDARLIVEPELAARAAARATEQSCAELRDSVKRMEQTNGRHAALIEEDLRFHRTIFQMADNRVCNVMFSIVHQSLHSLMEITSRMVGRNHTAKLHSRIYQAIRKGDSDEARSRMFIHLNDAKNLLLRSREEQRQGRIGDRFANLVVSE